MPETPFPVDVAYTLEVLDNSVFGEGRYDVFIEGNIVHSEDLYVTGTYDYPDIVLQLTTADDRSDKLIGEMDKDGRLISGVLQMPLFPVPIILSDNTIWFVYSAVPTDLAVTFARMPE